MTNIENKIEQTKIIFKEHFGLDFDQIEQGSKEWIKVKLGVIGASSAGTLLAKPRSKTALISAGAMTLCNELVSEVCTGQSATELNMKATDWGIAHEAAARSAYEFQTNKEVTEVPCIFADQDMRILCSPDGLILSEEKGVEIKCPYSSKNYIEFATDESAIDLGYKRQIQFSMFVTGLKSWDLCFYDPRMKKNKLTIKTFLRDEEMMTQYSEAVYKFTKAMDEKIEMMGVSFGDQWKGE